MTVKVPKVQNTVVHSATQHTIQTIEVEKPKIIHKIVNRKRPVIQHHITHIPQEVPQVQYIDKVVDVSVQKQRQVPVHTVATKEVHVPQQRHVPMVQVVQKTVEVPQVQYVDNHIHVPVHKQRHVPVHTVATREVPMVQKVQKT